METPFPKKLRWSEHLACLTEAGKHFLFVQFAASTSTMFTIAVHNVAYSATVWQNYALGGLVYSLQTSGWK